MILQEARLAYDWRMLLAIDTSSGTSVAVVDRDGGVLAERQELDTRRHAEVIGLLITEVLAEADITPGRLSAVVAGMGPGPFTGLRVGIAAARAFAFGAGKPCLPLVSHDAVAFGTGATAVPLLVVTDARRREVYFSAYAGLDEQGLPVRLGEPGLCKPGELEATIRASFAPHAEALLGNQTDPANTPISAGSLGMLGETLFARGRSFAADVPLYLRSPDVTVPGAPKRVS